MTTHLKKVIEPIHNGSSKVVVWIIYGVLGLILTITFFSFNNSNNAQAKTTELECKAMQNATNIQALEKGQIRIEAKLDRILERVK